MGWTGAQSCASLRDQGRPRDCDERPQDGIGPLDRLHLQYAKDEKGSLIGAVKLAYTDAPQATFTIPAGTKTVTGFNS